MHARKMLADQPAVGDVQGMAINRHPLHSDIEERPTCSMGRSLENRFYSRNNALTS
jgi:hypothetical protein